jgi:hypothetical protein
VVGDIDARPAHRQGVTAFHANADVGPAGPLVLVKPCLAGQPSSAVPNDQAVEELSSCRLGYRVAK